MLNLTPGRLERVERVMRGCVMRCCESAQAVEREVETALEAARITLSFQL